MASKKHAWWEAIDADLPESISALLDKTIDVSSVTAPADVDAAIIEQGKLAAKLNKLLDDLQGLSLVELALRIGQKNVTSKLMLLAGVEAIEETDDEGFIVLEPKDGGEYSPGEVSIQVKVNDDEIQSISVAVDDGDSQTLTREDDFKGSLLPTPGDRTATFTSDTELTKSVNFYSIEFMLETYPAEGEKIPGPVFEVRAEPSILEGLSDIWAELRSDMFVSPIRVKMELRETIWTTLFDIFPALEEAKDNITLDFGIIDVPLGVWMEVYENVEGVVAKKHEQLINFSLNLGTTLGELLGEALPGGEEEPEGGEEEPGGGEGEGA